MNNERLIRRVAYRYLYADQPPGQRKEVKDMVQPVNKPKGIGRTVLKNYAKPMQSPTDETSEPNRRDLRPQDVFFPKPDQVGVLSLYETGQDMSHAINKQIPKDKGYDTVSNLSQYLIETDGGGGTKPVK